MIGQFQGSYEAILTLSASLKYNITRFHQSSYQTVLKLSEILPQTLFVRVHIKQYKHFWRVTTKQYCIHFSNSISRNTLSGSYYKVLLHILSEVISNNIVIDTFKVTTKQYHKIILFYKFLSDETDIFRKFLPNTTEVFHRRYTRQNFFLSQMCKSLLTGLTL